MTRGPPACEHPEVQFTRNSGDLMPFLPYKRLAGIAAAAMIAVSPLLVPTAGDAATAPICRAHMTVVYPKDYTYDSVIVRTAPGASVRTVAYYKTTSTVKLAKAGPKGFATLRYYISSATPGFRVVVNVTAYWSPSDGSSPCRPTIWTPDTRTGRRVLALPQRLTERRLDPGWRPAAGTSAPDELSMFSSAA